MKKVIFIVLLVLVFCISFNSCCCPNTYQISGLKNFHPHNSEFGTSDKIIPENFIDKYNYIHGDYHYIEEGMSIFEHTVDRSIIYLSYNDAVYLDAKQYAMDNLDLSENVVEEYNGYIFYDNYADDFSYPHNFKRFAYNDDNNTLIFIGCYISLDLNEEVNEIADNWGTFLDKYYGEYYSFHEVK